MKQQRKQIEQHLIAKLSASMERAPFSTCRWVGSLFGLAFFGAFTRRRVIATGNLRLVYPDWSERDIVRTARRSAQNFGMSFCEFLHLGAASPREIAAYCEWQGLEHIQAGFERGHGVLLPTAHFGAWEVMGARAAQDFPLTVVVRLTSNQALRSHIEVVREKISVGMIHKNEPARASMKKLHKNEGLAIFADQHAGRNGLMLPMFGFDTRFHGAPARLALATNSLIVPTFGVRRKPWLSDGRVVIRASKGILLESKTKTREAAVLEGTQYIIAETEERIRRNPDQWLWMHRRWRASDWNGQENEAEGDDD
ncbi:MAG TPA: lysophospholipid acyltransferase family protein [Abditibacterium sp.]